jgi:hypothetical protein
MVSLGMLMLNSRAFPQPSYDKGLCGENVGTSRGSPDLWICQQLASHVKTATNICRSPPWTFRCWSYRPLLFIFNTWDLIKRIP